MIVQLHLGNKSCDEQHQLGSAVWRPYGGHVPGRQHSGKSARTSKEDRRLQTKRITARARKNWESIYRIALLNIPEYHNA